MDSRGRIIMLIASVLGGAAGGAVCGFLLHSGLPLPLYSFSWGIILSGLYHGACLGTAVGIAANMRRPIVAAILLALPLGCLSPLHYHFTEGLRIQQRTSPNDEFPEDIGQQAVSRNFLQEWVLLFALPVIVASVGATRLEAISNGRTVINHAAAVAAGAQVYWGLSIGYQNATPPVTGLIHGIAFGLCMATFRIIGRAMCKRPEAPVSTRSP